MFCTNEKILFPFLIRIEMLQKKLSVGTLHTQFYNQIYVLKIHNRKSEKHFINGNTTGDKNIFYILIYSFIYMGGNFVSGNCVKTLSHFLAILGLYLRHF